MTLRQRQVLQLVAEGKSAKEIAALMNISVRTAESHKYKIMQILKVRKTADLIQYANKMGLISI